MTLNLEIENRFRVLVILIASLVVTSCGGGGSGGANPPPLSIPPGSVGDGRLGELLKWAQSTQNLPVPAMAAVIVQNGQIAESAAIGLRSVDNDVLVTVDDQWAIGSLAKAITSTLAGVLVEQSLIRWDTTPVDVWPGMSQEIHRDFTT